MQPVSLYLDTADLSYLVLGKIPGLTAAEVTTVRDDLLALVRAGQLRLRLSLFHAAEIVLRAKVASAASAALRVLADEPNLTWMLTGPESIFAAELAGTVPTIEERPVPAAEIESLGFETARGVIAAAEAARDLKALVRSMGAADRLGAQATRGAARSRAADEKFLLRLLRGDLAAVPRPNVSVTRKRLRDLDAMLAARGWDRAFLIHHIESTAAGLGWAVLFRGSRMPRWSQQGWTREDAIAMPATVLRASMQRQRDRNTSRHEKPDVDVDLEYDARHIAYGAYSDIATIDGENLDAIKGTLPLLPRPLFLRNGRLLDVLEQVRSLITSRGVAQLP